MHDYRAGHGNLVGLVHRPPYRLTWATGPRPSAWRTPHPANIQPWEAPFFMVTQCMPSLGTHVGWSASELRLLDRDLITVGLNQPFHFPRFWFIACFSSSLPSLSSLRLICRQNLHCSLLGSLQRMGYKGPQIPATASKKNREGKVNCIISPWPAN